MRPRLIPSAPPGLRRLVVAALWLAIVPTVAVRAQPKPPPPAVAALEARLPALAGVERVRALARLADARKLDDPTRALAYGAEALRAPFAPADSAAALEAHVATLNELTWAYMTLGRYDSAAASAIAGRRLAEQTGNRLGAARALSNLGSLAQRRGDPHRAVALFEQAIGIQRALGVDSAIASSLNNLGFVYSTDLAEYDRSLAFHLEALRLRERLGDRSAIALSLNNIGIVYGRLRQRDRALEYFQRALAVRRALGELSRVAATLNNIGDMYLEGGDPARALDAHRESLAIRESIGEAAAVSLARRNVAVTHLAMHRPDLARPHVEVALRIGATVKDRGLAVRNLLAMAAVDQADARPAAAERSAVLALDSARLMRSRELERRALAALADAQVGQGRLAAAVETQRRLLAVSDSIFDETTARRIANLEQGYETERREREIERLRKEEALARVAEGRRAQQRDVAVGAVLLLAVLGGAAYRTRVVRTRVAEALSLTDALTGVRNRRYVHQTIAGDLSASLRRHRAAVDAAPPVDGDVVFFVIDVDHFKRVNDEFGHAAGDRVLTQAARVLEATCRESDVVVRWGGEEFLVVSRLTDRRQASAMAERIRETVAAHTTRLPDGRTIRVTCSIGFAAFPFAPEEPLGWEQVVAFADRACYAAKRAGRDAWVGYAHGWDPSPAAALYVSPDEMETMVADGRLRSERSATADVAVA